MNLKIGLITYDTPHLKSQQLFFRLLRKKNIELRIFTIPFKARKQRDISFHHRPHQNKGWSLGKIAPLNNIPIHDIAELEGNPHNLDYAIIGGAGLLDGKFTQSLKIINCHPGLIPTSRGLDSFKWSIHRGDPIGNTLHFIDEGVDQGEIIHQEQTPLYPEDTLEDFAQRHYEFELDILTQFDHYIQNGKLIENLPLKESTMRMKKDIEMNLKDHFISNYKPIHLKNLGV